MVISNQTDNNSREDNQKEQGQDYICGECGMTFPNSDQLTVHYRNSHYQDWQTTRLRDTFISA
jgi:uncharacterized Zn-finger protein